MELLCTLAALLVLPAFSALAQWSIVSATAEKMEEKQTGEGPKDFWLYITLQNDSN